jgi:hypothetical protein
MSNNHQKFDFTGPMEEAPWPDKLTARVVTPGANPRIHGYALETDLAAHYRFSEICLLMLTGEAPSELQGNACELALAFASACSVAEAPSHGALAAKMTDASPSGTLAFSSLILFEQARFIVEQHRTLLVWLDQYPVEQQFPVEFQSNSEDDNASVGRLRELLAKQGIFPPILLYAPSRIAAILGVFHWCGVRVVEQIQAIWVISRLACVAAEGFAAPALDLKTYPMNLPQFRYIGELKHDE